MNQIGSYLMNIMVKQLYPVVVFKVLPSNRPNKDSSAGTHSEIISHPKISKQLISPYSRNQNNCYQGIFNSGKYLIQNLFQLRAHLFPKELNFSIGIGTVDTPINPIMAVEVKGTAIKNAEFGLDKHLKLGPYLSINGFSKSIEKISLPSIELLWSSTLRWNYNRIKILNGLLDNLSEIEIAQNLGISQRAVYKNIAQARLKTWAELSLSVEENISAVLKQYKNH